MSSARSHDRTVLRLLASEAAAPGTAWRHPEGSRPRPRLRLAWSADRVADRPARAPEPAQAFAPHRGAACRLRSPGPSPTSSAPRPRERWVLEFEPTRRQGPDRLIGWIGGADPLSQVRLEFPSRAAALAYVRRHDLDCEVGEPRRRRSVPKPYAGNFLAPAPEARSNRPTRSRHRIGSPRHARAVPAGSVPEVGDGHTRGPASPDPSRSSPSTTDPGGQMRTEGT